MKTKKGPKLTLLAVGIVACSILLISCSSRGAYSAVTHALHRGMTYNDVSRMLGSGDWEGGDPIIYREPPATEMLLLYFDNPGNRISAWLIVEGPCKRGYSEYKVRKSYGYARDGRTEGPINIDAVSVTIATIDLSGQPFRGFENCH